MFGAEKAVSDTRCYMVVFGAFADFDQFMSNDQATVGRLMDKFGGQYVLIGDKLEALAGDFVASGGSVISVWPNRAAALSFWNAPEYQKLKKSQSNESKLQVVLIEAPTLAGVA
jgi:uncharacterized protein (DUF1330 family)